MICPFHKYLLYIADNSTSNCCKLEHIGNIITSLKFDIPGHDAVLHHDD